MKKIRSEFLTQAEAVSALEEIKPYCGNARITNYGESYSDYNYAGYISDSVGGFTGFPEMGSFGLGGFGMVSSWNFGLYTPYSLSDRYRRAYPYSRSGYDYPQERALLEADVADENYEYVRDKLYSFGAASVM